MKKDTIRYKDRPTVLPLHRKEFKIDKINKNPLIICGSLQIPMFAMRKIIESDKERKKDQGIRERE